MKINLIDPAFQHKAGHHFDINLRVAIELTNLNHDVTIYSNNEYIQDEELKNINIIPIFSISPYRILDKNTLANELKDFINLSNTYCQELKNISSADLIVVPTMFSYLLNAFAISKIKIPIAACFHFAPDFKNINSGKLLWLNAFRNARDNLSVNFGSLEEITRYQFLPLTFSKNFHKFPIPYDGVQPYEKKNKVETVGFFGQQRDEKGMRIITPLINFLVSKNISVILHDSSQKIKFNHSKVKCVNFVENLCDEISRCDLIILPYQQDEYRDRGSGILYMALASGIPVLVPSDTTLSKYIEFYKSGIIFHDNRIENLIYAFEIAQATYKMIKKNAFFASQSWAKENGTKKFVKFITDQSNFYKF